MFASGLLSKKYSAASSLIDETAYAVGKIKASAALKPIPDVALAASAARTNDTGELSAEGTVVYAVRPGVAITASGSDAKVGVSVAASSLYPGVLVNVGADYALKAPKPKKKAEATPAVAAAAAAAAAAPVTPVEFGTKQRTTINASVAFTASPVEAAVSAKVPLAGDVVVEASAVTSYQNFLIGAAAQANAKQQTIDDYAVGVSYTNDKLKSLTGVTITEKLAKVNVFHQMAVTEQVGVAVGGSVTVADRKAAGVAGVSFKIDANSSAKLMVNSAAEVSVALATTLQKAIRVGAVVKTPLKVIKPTFGVAVSYTQ